MKTIKQLAMLLIVGAVLLGLTNVTNMAADTYEEENIGKIKTSSMNKQSAQIIRGLDVYYQGDSLIADYQAYVDVNLFDSVFKIRQLTYSKNNKKSSEILYSEQSEYYTWNRGYATKSYKNYMYGVAYGFENKKNITVVVYNKKTKQMEKYKYAISNFLDNTIIRGRTSFFRCKEIKKIGKDKVQILYTVYRDGNDFVYGGIAVLNLKKNTIVSNKFLDFAPRQSDKKYIYGGGYHKEGCNDNLVIASYKTGKAIKTYSSSYGVDRNADYLFSGIEEGEKDYDNTRSDFKNGQVIIQNYSGIYYGGVNTEGLEKLMDIADLPYYTQNYMHKGFYGIALKNKKEFTIAYADTYEYPDYWLKRYVMK